MEDYIGAIRCWSGFRCPENFMFCEGQTMSIKNHEALFSIIGTNYGGDGINNFRLPDLRPKTIPNNYKLQNTVVLRAHETGDPLIIGYVSDGTVVHEAVEPAYNWGDSPKYMICITGMYPSFD